MISLQITLSTRLAFTELWDITPKAVQVRTIAAPSKLKFIPKVIQVGERPSRA
jgi:hypothetical protein